MGKRLASLGVALFLFSVPTVAFAAPFGLPDTIVPTECQNCPNGAAWGCVLQTFDNIIAFALAFALVLATIFFAYAGFLYVLSPASPENIKKGHKILKNTLIGLVVTFSAWLIVNTLLSTLTKYTVDSATSIFSQGATELCLPGANTSNTTTVWDNTPPDNEFTYQAGIIAQKSHISVPLAQLLDCMAKQVPGKVGQISSISDTAIITGTATWASCRAGSCAHGVNSCHYGGKTCGDKSYAVDFGDEQYAPALTIAANNCGATYVGYEGDHLHVSIGQAQGCGCN